MYRSGLWKIEMQQIVTALQTGLSQKRVREEMRSRLKALTKSVSTNKRRLSVDARYFHAIDFPSHSRISHNVQESRWSLTKLKCLTEEGRHLVGH
jgi:hypothetical protein